MSTLPATGARRWAARTLLLAMIATLSALFTGLTPAQASPHADVAPGAVTWSIQPSTSNGLDHRTNYTYTNFEAGATKNDFAAVTNYSAQPETFSIYAADAFNTATGGLDILAAGKKSVGVGAWITVAHNVVTIPASSRTIIPISIKVPKDASPGFHVGAIVASVSSIGRDASGNAVKVDRRIGARVYLQVAGTLNPVLKIDHTSLKYGGGLFGGPATVTFTVHNTGNVPLGGTADVSVGGLFGMLGGSTTVAVAELLPGGSVTKTARVSSVFASGHLTAKISIRPTSSLGSLQPPPAKATASTGKFVAPWLVLIIVVVLLLAFFGYRRYSLSAAMYGSHHRDSVPDEEEANAR